MSDVINMPEPDSAEWAAGQLLTPLDELLDDALAGKEVREALRDPALSAGDLRAETANPSAPPCVNPPARTPSNRSRPATMSVC